MKEKQPDFKKSKNDPYDLNSTTPPRRSVPGPDKPNPYDLDQGAMQVPKKRNKDNNG
jgi:hypothetical protein